MKSNSSFYERNDFLLFLLLSFIVYLSTYGSLTLIANEENYVGLAKQFMNPNWVPYSFHFNDVAGGRILFQLFFGKLFSLFDVVTITVLLRLLFTIPIIICLYKLFELVKINFSLAVPVLCLYFLPHQSLFGGEWILGGFESKTIAYIFILWSFSKLIQDDKKHQVFLISIAFYFHFLVGFWYTFFLVSYQFIYKRKFEFYLYLKIFFLILPLFLYLGYEYFISNPNIDFSYNPDWIYTYVRNPHHTAPFSSKEIFIKRFLNGSIVIGLFLLLHFTTKLKQLFLNGNRKRLYRIALTLSFMQLLLLFGSYFDKEGVFLKFYPFRLNSLLSLSYAIIISILLKEFLLKYDFNRIGLIILLTSTLGYSIKESLINLKKGEDKEIKLVGEYLKMNSEKDSYVLVIDNIAHTSLIRLSERNDFHERFIPTKKEKIVEWYERMIDFHKIKNMSKDKIDISTTNRRVDYVLCKRKRDNDNLVFSTEKLFLYKMK